MKSSIVRQLLTSTLLTLLVLWIAVVLSVSWVIKHETDEIFDSSLQETAQRLLPLAVMQLKSHDHDHEGEDHAIATDDGALEPTQHDEYMVYQVFHSSGHMLLRSHAAPVEPLISEIKPGFQRTAHHWIYIEKSRNGEFFLALAEKSSHRTDTLRSTLLFLLLPLLALLPVAAFSMLMIVRSANRPLQALDHEMAKRGGADLHCLASENFPRELQSLVGTLNQLMLRLKSALEAERSFTANSAHELRTPLAAAMAQLSVLEHTSLDESQLNTLQTVRALLDRLQRLGEKLLQLARAESGIAWKRADVDLNQLITLIAQDHQWRTSNHLELQLPSIPVVVQGDVDAIGIILSNLLENAIKYATPPGSLISIELNAQPAQIRIRNDCAALPAETVARLHERFFRARPNSHGAGLGLSIVHALLQPNAIELTLCSPFPSSNRGFEARLVWH